MSVSKNKVLPVLRFGEFSGNWDDIRFGDISTVIRGASPRPKGDPRYYGSGIPRLMVEDVARDGKFVDPVTDSLTKQGAQLSRYCKKGTLTIVCSGTAKTVGQASFLNSDACIHDGFLAMLDINADFLPDFIYYQVQKFQAQAERMATHGGTFINLTTSILKDFKRAFPTLSEQKKISEFLTSVDERIGQLIKKKALLEDYKKGVMQQLFSQQIRFKDDNGNDFSDWEEKDLIKVASPVKTKNRDMAVEVVLTNSATQGIISQRDYFDKDIANAKNIGGYYVVSRDDFVYNPRISETAPVGPIKRNHLSTGVMSPLYTVFRFKEGDATFFELYFQTSEWHKYMNSIANFGARHDRMAITTGDFYCLPMPFPSILEQKKIADFLSAIDQKIESVSYQIAKTQTFKKGLLQQMFV